MRISDYLNGRVNRCLVNGQAELLNDIGGKSINLRRDEALPLDECPTTMLESASLGAAVVQVGSRPARHVDSFLRVGETVRGTPT